MSSGAPDASVRSPSSAQSDNGEDRPLLGNSTTADNPDLEESMAKAQASYASLLNNLANRTMALAAQVGVILFAITTWVMLIEHPAGLFSYHPALQSLAIVFFGYGILVLQPTKSPQAKRKGQNVHQIFQGLALVSILGGVAIIIFNKKLHEAAHFATWHGILGITTVSLLVFQAIVGLLQAYPAGQKLLGGEAKAKATWKYHRALGYTLFILLILTPMTAVTSADWVLQNSSSLQRNVMFGGLALLGVGVLLGLNPSKMQFR
ncbi:uncharacterized protein L969DRAFT_81397 [Mixia osmundae IAM 14324]|uniref:Cytochrome b561 domain-containing protein n=1 Tax=Mixia osmundae (strain CBS 9802 / IAM 14324 / JCM 22182 / KY 12970) TaxID=764103 RepID=G7DYJ6_MIXOS|nr:uncharacterized protein L969DRAFT_81397 [Mixia osmundae IAM 14324]KEI41555.1 hypothetical protein L969DRAFT_81397 [Mixia osmundae IAM 14324]GAA95656.1 hypothetical protein E5Q_02312 [Mixia osmundae IAM 14324]